jgi:hypothetical protein
MTLSRVLDKFARLGRKPGKVVLSASMVKSGSAWYFNMTNDLLVAAGQPDIRVLREEYALHDLLKYDNCLLMDLSEPNLKRVAEPAGRGHTYVIKSHAGPSEPVRRRLADGTMLATYIFRDPRDVALSAFDHGQVERQKGQGGSFAHLDSLETAIQWVSEWPIKVWRNWQTVPQAVLRVRYEDLLDRPLHELGRLQAFLNIEVPREKVEAIVASYARPKTYGKLHFNKGVSGRYESDMSPSQLELCQQRFGDVLAEMTQG